MKKVDRKVNSLILTYGMKKVLRAMTRVSEKNAKEFSELNRYSYRVPEAWQDLADDLDDARSKFKAGISVDEELHDK
jgi:hypothetical protein